MILDFHDTCVNGLIWKITLSEIIKIKAKKGMLIHLITETNIWKASKYFAFLFKSSLGKAKTVCFLLVFI